MVGNEIRHFESTTEELDTFSTIGSASVQIYTRRAVLKLGGGLVLTTLAAACGASNEANTPVPKPPVILPVVTPKPSEVATSVPTSTAIISRPIQTAESTRIPRLGRSIEEKDINPTLERILRHRAFDQWTAKVGGIEKKGLLIEDWGDKEKTGVVISTEGVLLRNIPDMEEGIKMLDIPWLRLGQEVSWRYALRRDEKEIWPINFFDFSTFKFHPMLPNSTEVTMIFFAQQIGSTKLISASEDNRQPQLLEVRKG